MARLEPRTSVRGTDSSTKGEGDSPAGCSATLHSKPANEFSPSQKEVPDLRTENFQFIRCEHLGPWAVAALAQYRHVMRSPGGDLAWRVGCDGEEWEVSGKRSR